MTGRGRLANQAAGAQVCEGVKLIHRDEARDASATHRHDDLRTALDVLDVAAEAVVQLADAHFVLERFAMWRHDDTSYALHRPAVTDSRSSVSAGGAKVRVTRRVRSDAAVRSATTPAPARTQKAGAARSSLPR